MRRIFLLAVVAALTLVVCAGCGEPVNSSGPGNGLRFKRIGSIGNSSDIVCDRFGRIVVADADRGTVSCLVPGSSPVLLASGIEAPSGLTLDRMDNIFICSRPRGEVYRISPDGAVDVMARGLDRPFALALDRDGNVFVATAGDGGIWRGRGGALTTQ